MSRAADEARTRLWFWLGEADDSDAEQAAWKRRRLEGMLLACERASILPPDELQTWREIVARGAVPAARGGDTQATERHLELLVAELRPLSRHAQPSGRKGHHFRDALAALHAAGVLDDSARAEWQARELAATAPWLAADAIAQITASPEALWAIGVPAETPEQEAADAADAAQREASTRRGELRRVVVAREPLRRDGVAVIAVVARSEATDVVFHYVGPPHGDTSGGWADLEAFGQIVDSLTPPALTDDAGTTYQPVSPRPVSS